MLVWKPPSTPDQLMVSRCADSQGSGITGGMTAMPIGWISLLAMIGMSSHIIYEPMAIERWCGTFANPCSIENQAYSFMVGSSKWGLFVLFGLLELTNQTIHVWFSTIQPCQVSQKNAKDGACASFRVAGGGNRLSNHPGPRFKGVLSFKQRGLRHLWIEFPTLCVNLILHTFFG